MTFFAGGLSAVLRRVATPRAGLAATVSVGAGLRFWNLGAGLPYRIGVDEPAIADRAIIMMRTGDFNPHFFDYGGLYIYMQLAVACVRYILGAMDGLWFSVDEFWPEHVYLWTRGLNAALGTFTIYLVFCAASRWGTPVALLAAGLMAVWPNHVRESHFALTDVPLAMWTAAAFVLALRAYETGRVSTFVAAGIAVGLGAATKYNAALALCLIVMAAVFSPEPRQRRWGLIGAGAGGAAAGFVLGAPYTFLDLPGFLNAFGQLAMFYQPRPFADGAWIYLQHMRASLGWPAVIGIVVAAAWFVERSAFGRRRGRFAIAVAFPLVYFYTVATKELIFARYLLPIVPFFAVLLATLLVTLMRQINRLAIFEQRPGARRAAVAALALVVVSNAVVASFGWARQHGRRSTVDAAYQLVRGFIPPGSIVAVERQVLRLPDTLYRTEGVTRLTARSPQEYVSSGVTYFVASSDAFGAILDNPDRDPDAYHGYRKFFDAPGLCLPPIRPTADMPGPQIRICRIPTD